MIASLLSAASGVAEGVIQNACDKDFGKIRPNFLMRFASKPLFSQIDQTITGSGFVNFAFVSPSRPMMHE